jgi:hypothetical protein
LARRDVSQAAERADHLLSIAEAPPDRKRLAMEVFGRCMIGLVEGQCACNVESPRVRFVPFGSPIRSEEPRNPAASFARMNPGDP